MRYLCPALFLAAPAMAHPADLPHGHGAEWAAPLVLFLIGLAVVASRRKAARVRAGNK